MYKINIQQTFPEIETILRVFFINSIPNHCSFERSFSVLKIIKTRSKLTLTQEMLDNLGLLSIEGDFTSSLNIYDIINKFA